MWVKAEAEWARRTHARHRCERHVCPSSGGAVQDSRRGSLALFVSARGALLDSLVETERRELDRLMHLPGHCIPG